ncbi:MAG: ABC transporter substrate-binding protein [Deltaproteobacteria bacterium]|nr:ABC transporter substrate-binding protein [Deltaproteobacteria bacterium]
MRARITVIALALALAAIACKPPAHEAPPPAPAAPGGESAPSAPAAASGITDTEIRIGTWAPMSGPASAYGIVARSMQAYFDMVNEAGGVHGRKLVLLARDDGYQPSRTVSAVKEMIEKDGVFAFVGGVGTAPGMAVKDTIEAAGKVWVGPATGSSAWANPPSNLRFAVYPTYNVEAKTLVTYAAKNLKKTKFAIFYQNDAFGQEGVETVKATLAGLGLGEAAMVSHELTDTDLSSQALKLKSSGAEAVVLWSTTKFTATFVKECAKIKFAPQFLSTSTVTDPLMFQLAGDSWNGTILADWMPLPEDGSPGVQKYRDQMAKQNPPLTLGNYTMVAFALAEPLVEALRRAGPELTTDKVVAALESLQNWNGDYAQRITFGPNDRQGIDQVFLAQAREGKLAQLADWQAP